MKILDSNILSSSENYFKEMDLSLEKKSEKNSIRFSRQNSMDDSSDDVQLLVDRVRISQKEKFEYQYNYSGSLKGRSSVKSLEKDDIKDHAHQYAVEKLVGGVIDKNVVIRNIERKEDVKFSDQNNSQMDNSDNDKQNIQTRMSAAGAVEMKLVHADIHFEEENVQFESKGEVTTEDGRVINFYLDISLERSFVSRREQETIVERWQEQINLTDPLIISLDGRVPQLSDTTFEFDLNSDGKMENINFTNPGSGFLAFDKNSDNKINSGSELFGPGTGNGFEELAAFDEDRNQWIDENDAVFSKLSVWTKDEKGKDLLVSLKDAGIGAISLSNEAAAFNMTQTDNTLQGQLKSSGVFIFENGDIGSVHQIDLADRTKEMEDSQKAQLELKNARDTQEDSSALLSSQALNSPQFQEQQLQDEVPDPLQDIIDRVEKLKEEMERLYESMNPVSSHKSAGLSKSGHYLNFNPDPSILLSGFENSVLSRSWYA